jgi:hypothetical protein
MRCVPVPALSHLKSASPHGARHPVGADCALPATPQWPVLIDIDRGSSAAPMHRAHVAFQPTRSATSNPCGCRARMTAASIAFACARASAVPQHARGRRCSTIIAPRIAAGGCHRAGTPAAGVPSRLALRLRLRRPRHAIGATRLHDDRCRGIRHPFAPTAGRN